MSETNETMFNKVFEYVVGNATTEDVIMPCLRSVDIGAYHVAVYTGCSSSKYIEVSKDSKLQATIEFNGCRVIKTEKVNLLSELSEALYGMAG